MPPRQATEKRKTVSSCSMLAFTEQGLRFVPRGTPHTIEEAFDSYITWYHVQRRPSLAARVTTLDAFLKLFAPLARRSGGLFGEGVYCYALVSEVDTPQAQPGEGLHGAGLAAAILSSTTCPPILRPALALAVNQLNRMAQEDEAVDLRAELKQTRARAAELEARLGAL